MIQDRNFNPKIVHDAAAYLFWNLAESIGVAEANNAVVESAGQCLLKLPFTVTVLAQYGFEKLPPADKQEFGNAVATEAERYAIKGENMDGIIYADDAQGGRSPSAQDVDTLALRVIPRRVTSNESIQKLGRLCLRHPLPAVVFSDTVPRNGIIEVADTYDALGFQLPIFMFNAASQQLADGLFVSRGVFHIPVPSTRHGVLWDTAIQNSSRFVSRIKFYGEATEVTVEVEWYDAYTRAVDDSKQELQPRGLLSRLRTLWRS